MIQQIILDFLIVACCLTVVAAATRGQLVVEYLTLTALPNKRRNFSMKMNSFNIDDVARSAAQNNF